MDTRVTIMCDVAASGIRGEVEDSYLMGVELRPAGGAMVTWTDLPDQAMVFDDASAAAEFCRDSPLEMFVVYFAPAPGGAPPAPPRLRPPDPPSKPISLADELRAMGWT